MKRRFINSYRLLLALGSLALVRLRAEPIDPINPRGGSLITASSFSS